MDERKQRGESNSYTNIEMKDESPESQLDVKARVSNPANLMIKSNSHSSNWKPQVNTPLNLNNRVQPVDLEEGDQTLTGRPKENPKGVFKDDSSKKKQPKNDSESSSSISDQSSKSETQGNSTKSKKPTHVKAIVVDSIDKQGTFSEQTQGKMNGNKVISSIWYLGVVLLLCLIMIVTIMAKILLEDTQNSEDPYETYRSLDTLQLCIICFFIIETLALICDNDDRMEVFLREQRNGVLFDLFTLMCCLVGVVLELIVDTKPSLVAQKIILILKVIILFRKVEVSQILY